MATANTSSSNPRAEKMADVLVALSIKQLFFCKFRELVLRCCALAANQGVMFR